MYHTVVINFQIEAQIYRRVFRSYIKIDFFSSSLSFPSALYLVCYVSIVRHMDCKHDDCTSQVIYGAHELCPLPLILLGSLYRAYIRWHIERWQSRAYALDNDAHFRSNARRSCFLTRDVTCIRLLSTQLTWCSSGEDIQSIGIWHQARRVCVAVEHLDHRA